MTGDDAHIDADTASAYAGHALTDDQRAQVEEHIDACAACRELVSTLAKVAWSQTPISGSKVVAVDPAAILPPGTRVGPFEIERPLDAGGMGLVYSATDARLDRRVALKCVREARGDSEQLMREARVMAQLAHPNVVPVYDVVEAFGQVFIAMELVVGRSLRQWLGEQPRGWASVVDAFLEAGAGLAAAHAAGIVHGDVKPANILVGDDGRIRVTDFGLATSAGEAASEQQGLRGTPAYVAPEQRRGQPCDARSDEYSFCVSLHEALYGTLPGKQPSSGVRVPRGVQRVLARGLMEDPAARFGSMKRLLVALRAARSSRRWFVAAVVLLAAAVVMAYDVGGRRAELDQCAAVANELSSVWNAQARQTVRASFERTRLSYAAQTLAGVEANLDAWTTAFDALRRRACETDWLRRETPLERLGAQMRCLTQANREARALVTQLSDADETVVLHSVAASEQLPSLERCAQGPVVAVVKGADEKASNELRDALAHASALFDSGRYDAALKEVTALMPRMPGPADPELTAQVQTLLGRAQARASDYEHSSPQLLEAIQLAESAQADRVAASAWAALIQSEFWQGHSAQVVFLRNPALGACERASDVWQQTEVLLMVGGALLQLGRLQEAQPLFEQAVTLRQSLYGPKDRRVAYALSSLGNALSMQGNLDGGIDAHARAVVAAEASLGRPHPNVAVLHQNLGDDYLYGLRIPEAVTELQSALAVLDAAGEPKRREVAMVATDLGLALLEAGEAEKALTAFERANALWDALSPEHPSHGEALMGEYQALVRLGRAAKVTELERALVFGKGLPPFERGRIELALGQALGAATTPSARAMALVRQAIEGFAGSALPLVQRDAELARQWVVMHEAKR